MRRANIVFFWMLAVLCCFCGVRAWRGLVISVMRKGLQHNR